MESENGEVNKKILVLGLDNSGKTSIVLSLKGEQNLMSFYSLRPTPGIDYHEIEDSIEDLRANYFVWDLGGQAKYRERHLEKIGDYLTDVGMVIFVIDVQDTDRYAEALQYFQDIIERIGDRMESISLVVYLHKFDPSIELQLDHALHQSIRELAGQLLELAPRAKLFKTSIYTMFRKISYSPSPPQYFEP
jgi:GTPase SAR1 family protein